MARLAALLLLLAVSGCRFGPYALAPRFPSCFSHNRDRVIEARIPCIGLPHDHEQSADSCYLLRDQLPHVYSWIRLMDAECEAWDRRPEGDDG